MDEKVECLYLKIIRKVLWKFLSRSRLKKVVKLSRQSANFTMNRSMLNQTATISPFPVCTLFIPRLVTLQHKHVCVNQRTLLLHNIFIRNISLINFATTSLKIKFIDALSCSHKFKATENISSIRRCTN